VFEQNVLVFVEEVYCLKVSGGQAVGGLLEGLVALLRCWAAVEAVEGLLESR